MKKTAIMESIEKIEELKQWSESQTPITDVDKACIASFNVCLSILNSNREKEREQLIEHGIMCYSTGYIHRDYGRKGISIEVSNKYLTETYGELK